MSSGGGTETTAEPWTGAQPGLIGWDTSLLPQAQVTFEQQMADNVPYTGQLAARPGETLLQAQDVTLGLAGQVPGQAQPVTQYGQDVLAGEYLSAESNPYLQSYMQSAIDPLQQSLMEEIMPGIRGEAISAGGYGGSRQGIAEGQAIDAYLQEAGAITSQMSAEAYEAERARQMAAPGVVAQGMQLELMQPELMGQVGMQQQAAQQAILDEQYALWQMAQQQPWVPLQEYANILLPSAGLGGVQTSTPEANPLGGALGGAATGAAIGSAVPVVGTAIGAGVGAVGGYLASS